MCCIIKMKPRIIWRNPTADTIEMEASLAACTSALSLIPIRTVPLVTTTRRWRQAEWGAQPFKYPSMRSNNSEWASPHLATCGDNVTALPRPISFFLPPLSLLLAQVFQKECPTDHPTIIYGGQSEHLIPLRFDSRGIPLADKTHFCIDLNNHLTELHKGKSLFVVLILYELLLSV